MTTPYAPAYILIASGSIATPKLEICLNNCNTDDRAQQEASTAAAALFKAGYFQFSVWCLRGQHRAVCYLTVEQADPLVTAKAA